MIDSYKTNKNNKKRSTSNNESLNSKSNNKRNYEKKSNIQSKKKQTTTETIKNSKYEFLANRTVDLNDRLDEVINQSTNKFNIIKDNVRKKIIFYNR